MSLFAIANQDPDLGGELVTAIRRATLTSAGAVGPAGEPRLGIGELQE